MTPGIIASISLPLFSAGGSTLDQTQDIKKRGRSQEISLRNKVTKILQK